MRDLAAVSRIRSAPTGSTSGRSCFTDVSIVVGAPCRRDRADRVADTIRSYRLNQRPVMFHGRLYCVGAPCRRDRADRVADTIRSCRLNQRPVMFPRTSLLS